MIKLDNNKVITLKYVSQGIVMYMHIYGKRIQSVYNIKDLGNCV